MKTLLKDLAALCTLPILYTFVLNILCELFYRELGINVLDDSTLFSGGVFIALSVMFSVAANLINDTSEEIV